MERSASSTPSVTLKTIANELGVSVTTVARAMKDGHKVGADMIVKVRETADRLGYVRNLEGAKLRTGKTLIAMAFLNFTEEEEIGDSGAVGLLNGFHKCFAGTDYAVRAVPAARDGMAVDRLRELVRGRLADGVILDLIELQDARVRYLLEADFPFVTYGRTELFSEHAWFDIDNEFAAWQSTDALLRDGFKRIALIDGDTRYTFVRQRVRGYERALREHGIEPDPGLRHHSELAADLARGSVGPLLDRRADGFVCANELTFLGARAGVRDRIGDEVRHIGFALRSGTQIGKYVSTKVHASHYSHIATGRALAELLLKQIDGADPRECQQLAKTTLITTENSSEALIA
ncbi:LacI family DNA-binding transcriptional regulator [Paracoccus aestuariivivens]|uniref:LacI family DNA-binding transcriptional regulator n=1 Tax=Paracoccus aestuariivivens TaxID=1820333 RepID=A0A6L6JBT8_9RHOB|nr:LacI family DNA-binding transcriptional regulator [Paracoccus aestuariivivens]MTH78097.1 LacI family DNA-binding transcriptional regulator [Paracoccus aestuariivivens]